MTGATAKLAEGRIYTAAEAEANSRMALIGRNGVEAFFGSPGAEAIGKSIQLRGKSYAVIGVLDDGMTGTDYCNVYLPAGTVSQDFGDGWDHLSSVVGLAREGADIESVQEQTIEQLAKIKDIPEEEHENMIWVYSMKSSIDQLDTFMMSFQLIMGSVAGISLLVGGIGIMNMMLTNVTERIREIGVRRALGARGRDITMQFLAESAALCVTGGVIGTIAGYAIAWGLAFAAGAFGLDMGRGRDITMQFLAESAALCVTGGVIGTIAGYAIAWGLAFAAGAFGLDMGAVTGMGGSGATLTPAIEPAAIAIAVGISILIGLVFGYYPARRAAKLDPVECLRYQ